MKLFVTLSSAAALLLSTSGASWLSYTNDYARRGGDRCKFTISSATSFTCPVGQLPDGQIRLNGSEDTASFYIASNGGIVDSRGFGCLVTDPPTTQVQCDQGQPPAPGFSVDASESLLYQGSPNFYACPATDTEYNVYVNPDFGQTKCFPITLKTSGCGVSVSSSSCALPSTVWQTQTVTQDVTQTITVLRTGSEACTSVPPVGLNSTICPHCNHTKSVETYPTDSPTESWKRSITDVPQNEERLAPRSPSTHMLSKRDLFSDWYGVFLNKSGFVPTDQVKAWNLAFGESQSFATSQFYGCTIFVVVSSRRVLVGHARQLIGSPLECPLHDEEGVTNVLIPYIDARLPDQRVIDPTDDCNSVYVVIMGFEDPTVSTGPPTLMAWFRDQNIASQNIGYFQYRSTTAPIDPATILSGPVGKSFINWVSFGGPLGGQMYIYFSSDTARLTVDYNSDGTVSDVTRDQGPKVVWGVPAGY